MPSDLARARAALGALAFGLAAPCAYFAERLYERRNGGVETPLTILRSLHTGYYYRVVIALLLGTLAAFLCGTLLELRRHDGSVRDTRAFASSATLLAAAFIWLAVRYA